MRGGYRAAQEARRNSSGYIEEIGVISPLVCSETENADWKRGIRRFPSVSSVWPAPELFLQVITSKAVQDKALKGLPRWLHRMVFSELTGYEPCLRKATSWKRQHLVGESTPSEHDRGGMYISSIVAESGLQLRFELFATSNT